MRIYQPGSSYSSSPYIHGADVTLNLSFSESSREVVGRYTAHLKGGGCVEAQTLSEGALAINEIAITTDGGRGKDGKNGVDGASGRNGRDGDNATQYSNGTNGEDGGPGCDGTPGTSGEPGGDGGDVLVNIHETDTDLLMLLRVSNNGGLGGAAGRHGHGGAGGRGGRGGSAHSWSELNTYNNQTEYRYRPGGNDGRRGRDGYTPSTRLYPGRHGSDGRLTIKVADEFGSVPYSGVYSLRLAGFQSEALSRNGIYEPGDTVEVRNIQIHNAGQMPTPRGKRIAISIAHNDWISTNQLSLHLIDPIYPGQTVTISGRMLFTLREYYGDGREELHQKEKLDLNASALRLNRRFNSFSQPQGITLSHPIKIAEIRYPRSLLTNEVSKITFDVENSSFKDIGPLALEKALQRAIRLSCAIHNSKNRTGKLLFCDSNGTIASSPQIDFDFAKIQSLGRSSVSCYARLENSQQGHAAHLIPTTLSITKIGAERERKNIHLKILEIREGVPYRPRPSDDALLVINEHTTDSELTAWLETAKELGIGLSVWDTSVYGHLQMSAPAGSAQAATLLDTWKDKLVIVLNQQNSALDGQEYPFALLSSADLDTSIRKNNIKFYAVGASVAMKTRPSLMLELPITEKSLHSGAAGLKSSLSSQLTPSTHLHVIEVSRHAIKRLSKPPQEAFEAEVVALRKWLTRRYPNESFNVIGTPSPSTQKTSFFGAITKEYLGRIEVQREEQPAESTLLQLTAEAARAHDPAFVRSNTNKVALLASIPSKQLVDRLVTALIRGAQNVETMDLLCSAFAYKVAVEAGFCSSENDKRIFKGTPTLELFRDEIIRQTNHTTLPIISAYALIASRLQHIQNQEIPLLSRLTAFGTNGAIARNITLATKQIEDHLIGLFSAPEKELFGQQVSFQVKELQRVFKDKKKARFLDALLNREPSSDFDVVGYNPYLTRASGDISAYTQKEEQIKIAVRGRALARKAMIVRS